MPFAAFSYRAANDSDYWRLRAEEARTTAESFNSQAREQMMRIADAYEQLAELAMKGSVLPIGEQSGKAR